MGAPGSKLNYKHNIHGCQYTSRELPPQVVKYRKMGAITISGAVAEQSASPALSAKHFRYHTNDAAPIWLLDWPHSSNQTTLSERRARARGPLLVNGPHPAAARHRSYAAPRWCSDRRELVVPGEILLLCREDPADHELLQTAVRSAGSSIY